MMITMSLIALGGAAAFVFAALWINHRAAVRKRAASAALDEEVQEKLKRAKALDTSLTQEILSGADMDGTFDNFIKDRLSIHALPNEKGWLWDSDHLAKWAKADLASRVAAINHKARLITLTVLVAVALVVTVIDACIYNFQSTPIPPLSPYPPAKASSIPFPVPSSVQGTITPSSSATP